MASTTRARSTPVMASCRTGGRSRIARTSIYGLPSWRPQYDTYQPLPGLHIVGNNVLGEAIADLAGLSVSLKAYHLSLENKPAPVLDGYTGEQRFFLSYGQISRVKARDSALRAATLSDEHAVSEYRVIGATRNVDGWYSAFDVKPGDIYYLPKERRVRVW